MLMRMLVKDLLRVLAVSDERFSFRQGRVEKVFEFSRGGYVWHWAGKFVCVLLTGLALSITEFTERLGCAPYGRHTLIRCAHPSGQPAAVTSLRFVALACPRESNQREGHPTIRPRLRRGSLAPSPLQGHAAKGHPWPIAALATSMSLNPLRGDSTRPPEGDLGVVCTIAVEEQRQGTDAANFNFAKITQARGPVPFRRPSGGVA